MTLGGRSAFDDPRNMLDEGGTLRIQKNLIVDGTIQSSGGGELLANNEYLQAANAAGSADLNLLKADATDNTVVNAATGKQGKLAINNVTILTWAATLLAPLTTAVVALGTSALGFAGLFLSLGETIHLKTGANAKAGTVTVNGTTPVPVATTAFTANSVVVFSLKTVGGTVGAIPKLVTATPATGFDVAATASDTSVYNWAIIEIA